VNRQILSSDQGQSGGLVQIARAMDNINQITPQNLGSIRQAEKAVRDLSSLAQQMEELVTRYKLEE
jgi:methyl-accepting chemotaxis protein